jgi:transposase InsO family protein
VDHRPDLRADPIRDGLGFIIDAFSRMIVGWRVASHMRTDMVLDDLEMARRSRGAGRLVGLITHSDDPKRQRPVQAECVYAAGDSPRCQGTS